MDSLLIRPHSYLFMGPEMVAAAIGHAALGARLRPAGGKIPGEDGGAASARDADPPAEHLVAGPLDLIQDAAIQLERRLDARPRGRRQQVDAPARCQVVRACPLDLEGQQR